MSHDGSSCRSYIKHPTEKERLDNLAFTSFPEDYLPYTSAYHQGGRGGKAPPYLVWEERRGARRRRGRGRRGCCSTTALVSAIALIIAAILAVVAISIYLGVVTNLFRSPVLSFSGKFRVVEGDEFSESLLNVTSYQFLSKAETYQAMVENVFLSSSLEPAFIATRIYSFRPGHRLLVFFRVYLDRRKLLQSDEDTLILIQELMRQQAERKIPAFNALVLEPDSIQLTENEDWLSVPLLDQRPETIEIASPVRPGTSAPSAPSMPTSTSDVTSTSPRPSQPPSKALKSLPSTPALKRKTTAAPSSDVAPVAVASTKLPPPQYVPVDDLPDTGTGQVIAVGPINPEDDTLHYNYGQWRPVPVDGSVSPSFKDQRTPPGRGSVRLLDDPSPPNKNDHAPMTGVGSVRVLEDPMSHVDPPIPMQRPRPVVSIDAENTQKGTPGGVASSIMSSVSLMIMPSKKNRTLPNDAEGIGSVQVVPHVMLEKDSSDRFGDRKEHASYRILTDVKESDHGESETEKTLFPESVARETDSALTKDAAVFKESEVEYADNQSDNRFESNPSRVTAPTVLVESKANNSNPSRPRESKVDHAEVKFHESKAEYADNDDALTDQGNTEEKLRESKVEYEERIQESDVEYVDHASIVSNSKVNYAYNDNLNESKIEYSENEDYLQDSRDKVQQTFVKVSQTNSIEDNIMTTDSSQTDFREIQSTKSSQSSIEDNKNIVLDISVPLPVSVMFPPVEEFKFPSEKMSPTTSGLNTEQAERTDTSLYTPTSTISELTEDKKPSPPINDDLENIPLLLSEIEIDLKRLKPLHSTTVRSSYDDSRTTKESELEENLPGAYEDEDGQDDYFSTFATADLEEVSDGHSEDDATSNFDNIFSTSANDFENASMLDSSFSSSPGFLMTDESFLMDEETLPENESVRIVNRSQYPTTDTKYQTIQREDQNGTYQDVFHGHTGVGHGFHDPKRDATRDMVHATTSPIGISEDSTRAGVATGSNAVGSGIPKIVPQFVDRHSNDIDSDAVFNGLDEGFLNRDRVTDLPSSSFDEGSREDDVIRHMTTVPVAENASLLVSVENHPNFVTPICSEEEMLCNSGECVPISHRCNMRRDCRDNSDERNCSCAEKLKVMGQSQKICDGVQDCRDQTDENNCPWCAADQFICPQTKLCVNRSQVCDDINDCPRGADERYCVKLAENASAANGLHYYSEGYLMVRKEGRWGKLCTDNLHDTADLKVKIDELGKAVCSTLTYKELVQADRFKDTQKEAEDYYKISPNKPPRQKRRSSAIFYPSECPSKDVLRVKCGSLECGVRPLGSGSRRRIVGGDSADSGSWPWQAALYKEGDFQCGAVLVSDRWLVSAGHCFYSTQAAHWTARLGLLRRGSELASPSEEIRRIVRIVLHPDYIDKGFINDISLLRLDSPVPFSDYLRPLCFPEKHEEASLWHGRQCSVVGWGKLFEIGHTFPDSLQEVRLPVISTEECRKRIIFLTMYHITDNMFCAGFERGGRDACLGDSGGPLMCQRTDGHWILLGVTSNGDGCGRPGRPGVYTKVTRYLGWLQQVMGADSPIPTITDACEGVRCPLGRCVPPYKVCDGRWDCSDGSDEEHCFT